MNNYSQFQSYSIFSVFKAFGFRETYINPADRSDYHSVHVFLNTNMDKYNCVSTHLSVYLTFHSDIQTHISIYVSITEER